MEEEAQITLEILKMSRRLSNRWWKSNKKMKEINVKIQILGRETLLEIPVIGTQQTKLVHVVVMIILSSHHL